MNITFPKEILPITNHTLENGTPAEQVLCHKVNELAEALNTLVRVVRTLQNVTPPKT